MAKTHDKIDWNKVRDLISEYDALHRLMNECILYPQDQGRIELEKIREEIRVLLA